GPRPGYGVKKAMAGRLAHFWSESFGQIYPILRRLAADGLIVGRRHAQRGKPDRHVYAITPRGLEHLRAWLAVPAPPESFRSELLLKLFLGGLVSVETSLGQIREFGKRQDALLQ